MSLKDVIKTAITTILPPADEPIPNATAAQLYDKLDQILGEASGAELTDENGIRVVVARSGSDAFHVERDGRQDVFLVVQRHMAWRHVKTPTGLDKRVELREAELLLFSDTFNGMLSLPL